MEKIVDPREIGEEMKDKDDSLEILEEIEVEDLTIDGICGVY